MKTKLFDDDFINIFWDRLGERTKETILALKNNRKPNIIRYALHITSFCNMNCKYCREDKRNPKIMDRSFFRKLCLNAGKKGIIHITGGEPMIVHWLEEEIYQNRSVTQFALNSNAFILPKDKTLETIFRYKTSLDDYDEKRWDKITGGYHFKKVVSNIKKITETVKYVSICYTATHNNANRLGKFIDFCNLEFPKLFAISVSFYKGKGKKLILTKEDIDNLFQHSKKLNPISNKLFLATHSKKGNYFPNNIKIPCYLSLTERLYDEYNKEYHCSHLYRDKVIPPGNPGKNEHCITGCNLRFGRYNKDIHNTLERR